MIIFWACFHSIMLLVLTVIWAFSEIARNVKEIRNNEKRSNEKKAHSIGESIMMIIIMLAVFITILFFISIIVVKMQAVAVWTCVVFGIVYVYIAVKQTIKVIFVSEKRAFSFSDIQDFIYTYMGWWLMAVAVYSIELGDGKLDKLMSTYGEIVNVGMILFWYYFNILYAFGGVYILLYYLWKVVKYVANKFDFKGGKKKNIVSRIRDLWQQKEKFTELKSFRIWREENGKSFVYKLFMTIPLLIVDICRIIYLFTKYIVWMTLASVIVSIFDQIRVLYKGAKNLWNRYENNEWMFLLAQISGLLSYVIVFLIIQYGEYAEETKKIYEFAGTIVLIPYFFSKIVNVNKDLKEDKTEENIEGEKEYAIPENMVYNEDGEGVINCKTIRQLEYEAMQNAANNPEFVKTIDTKK